eukprot:TRINITY_DN4373_c0_g1_i6.p1 TRINITY_DN4373_c0_g1~~TRINITY_DN4373_c0_g1_i6.p1  ORF type:complete len:258 (-),score=40.93 TRINITY_DN4373_c0_g1_i6:203-934(-)
MEYALDMCANLPWRKHSVKLAVWMGDAPPHGYQGFLQHQAEEREREFEVARQGVLAAAQKLEKYIIEHGFKRSAKVTKYEARLEHALDVADSIARFYDEHSKGAPGGHLWQDATQRLADKDITMLAFGFRDVVVHEASQGCLRTIAHMTHGAFVDVPDISGYAMQDFITSAANTLLSRQLVLEEMVDLALCTRSRLMAVDYNIRMREICEALNATGSLLTVIEGTFNYENTTFGMAVEHIMLL